MWLPVASCGFLQLHQVRRPPVDTFETFDIAPMSGKPVGHDSFVGFPAGFLVGFWLSLWRNCSFFRANLGNYLLWCWWSCGLVGDFSPNNCQLIQIFGIIGTLPVFPAEMVVPLPSWSIIYHDSLLLCCSYYLLILVHMILLSPYHSSPGFENPEIRWNLTHRIQLGLSSTKIKKPCCQKTYQHLPSLKPSSHRHKLPEIPEVRWLGAIVLGWRGDSELDPGTINGWNGMEGMERSGSRTEEIKPRQRRKIEGFLLGS